MEWYKPAEYNTNLVVTLYWIDKTFNQLKYRHRYKQHEVNSDN